MRAATTLDALQPLSLEGRTLALMIRLDPAEAASPDLYAHAEQAVRRLLPFFMAALVHDLTPALDALGVPASAPLDEDEADEEPEEAKTPSPTGYSLDQLQARVRSPRARRGRSDRALRPARDRQDLDR